MKHATCATPVLLIFGCFLMTLQNMYNANIQVQKQYQYINTIGKNCSLLQCVTYCFPIYTAVKYATHAAA